MVSWIRTFFLEVALIDWRFISNHPLPIGDYSTTDKRHPCPEEKDLQLVHGTIATQCQCVHQSTELSSQVVTYSSNYHMLMRSPHVHLASQFTQPHHHATNINVTITYWSNIYFTRGNNSLVADSDPAFCCVLRLSCRRPPLPSHYGSSYPKLA